MGQPVAQRWRAEERWGSVAAREPLLGGHEAREGLERRGAGEGGAEPRLQAEARAESLGRGAAKRQHRGG